MKLSAIIQKSALIVLSFCFCLDYGRNLSEAILRGFDLPPIFLTLFRGFSAVEVHTAHFFGKSRKNQGLSRQDSP